MGYITVEMVTLYMIMGMNGAMETLVAQAYGAGQLKLCGIYLNRAFVINTVIQVPLMVLALFSKQILLAIGQSEAVADYA